MIKLRTPVQYEDVLDELNIVRSLSLNEVSRIELATPVLCKNPVSVGKPAIGKLLRSDEQGALLKSNSFFADKFESVGAQMSSGNLTKTITFSRKVKGVLVGWFETGPYGTFWWSDDTYTAHYKVIPNKTQVYLPFNGTVIHFVMDWTIGSIIITVLGFYK